MVARCAQCGTDLTYAYIQGADDTRWCLSCASEVPAALDELAAERQRRASGAHGSRPVTRQTLPIGNTAPTPAEGTATLLPFPRRQTPGREL
jgi:hypothetical protein